MQIVPFLQLERLLLVKDLADMLQQPYNEVIKTLLFLGVMAAMNQEIDYDTAAKVCEKYEILCEKKVSIIRT